MNATDVLKHEHRAIETVLTTLEIFAERLDAGDSEIDPSIVDDSLEFLGGFGDRCHHAKEEDILFPLLEERGIRGEGGPIGAMLHEHDEGRELIKTMRKNLDKWTAGDRSGRKDLSQAMKCYVILLRSHIMKEDQVLFELAQAALSDEDNRNLIHQFSELEEKKIGHGMHERYHRMLDDLEERCKKLHAA